MNYFFKAMEKETGVAPAQREEPVAPVAPVSTLEPPVTMIPTEAAPLPAVRTFSLPSNNPFLYTEDVAGMTPERRVAMENCRTLRSRVFELMNQRKARTLMVTSAVASEGKTTTAVNLAYFVSSIEHVNVLLVDCDLRKPSIASLLGFTPENGVDRYLAGNGEYAPVFLDKNPRLAVLPCTTPIEHSADLLHRPQLAQLLAQAASDFQMVIVDSPPLTPLADGQILLQSVDAALLCVRAGQSPIELAMEAANLAQNKLLGSVLVGYTGNLTKQYYAVRED